MYGHEDGFNMLGGYGGSGGKNSGLRYTPPTPEELEADAQAERKAAKRTKLLLEVLEAYGIADPKATLTECAEFLQLEDVQYCGYPDEDGRDKLAEKLNTTRDDIDKFLAAM